MTDDILARRRDSAPVPPACADRAWRLSRWRSPSWACCWSPSSSAASCRSTRCWRSSATARPKRRWPAVRDKLGLDLPLWQQFCIYSGDARAGRSRHLDPHRRAGRSTRSPRYFPATLELATLGTIFGTLVGVPAGVLAATRPGSSPTRSCGVVGLMGYSVPVFWLGLMGLLVFYGQLAGSAGPGRLDPPMT